MTEIRTSSDSDAPRGRLRLVSPRASLGHRVWFGWAVSWIFFWTACLSPFVVLNSAIAPTARTFVRWMRPWARILFAGLGVRPRVEMRGAVPDEPVVYVANHQNALDIPATAAAIPKPFLYVARHELRSWPFVGWVLDRTACLFIDRDNPRRALQSLKDAAERVRGGESVLLFPEGGRSYRHGLNSFMRGSFLLAIEAGVPVVPVVLIGHVGVVDEAKRLARPGEVLCVIGDPIPTEGLSRRDSGALCDRVRAAMETEMARFG